MAGQTEDTERITTVTLTYHVEQHREKTAARAMARWSPRPGGCAAIGRRRRRRGNHDLQRGEEPA
jgi:hypothetical protein